MKEKIILIIGAGHLAFRLKKYLALQEYQILITNVNTINAETESFSLIENLGNYIDKIDVSSIAMVYLLEDKDEDNLHLYLHLSLC